jgi:protein-disulfide isomerase/uncharacterized membrane protein/thiol-disulfide isomerase/thioredoxin
MGSRTDIPRVGRAWALLALLPVLLLSAGVAAYLGWVHILLTHGEAAFESACKLGGSFDCDKVNTSRWSELFGLPISLWAVPLYLAMGWLALVGGRADRRGQRARGALALLSGWNLAVSLFLAGISVFVLEYICLFCVGLYALHALALLLVLLPPGGRRPALPGLADTLGCGLVALISLGLLYPLVFTSADALDAAVVQGLEEAGGAEDSEIERSTIRLPSRVVDIGPAPHSPARGPLDAPVEVVIVSDFQCGFCRKLVSSLATLEERYRGRVRWVFRHFPLDRSCNEDMKRSMHPQACLAASAAQCAHRQGRFWDYHDALFLNQGHLERDDLLVYAGRLDLDTAAFDACLSSPEPMEELRADIAAMRALEITGTPRTFIAGREFSGAVSTAILDAGIRVALGEAEAGHDGTVQTMEERLVDEPLSAGALPMVRVQRDDLLFWIDAVEASLDGHGRALSTAGSQPANASWFMAREACAAAGKRMCSAREWLSACRGALATDDDGDGAFHDDYIEGSLYPYGPSYEARRCNDQLHRAVGRARPAGAHSRCSTPDGVYDLTGNLSEWVGEEPGEALQLGGAFFAADKASCGAAVDVFGPAFENIHTGFRCCADQPVDGLPLAEPVPRISEPIAAGATFPVLPGKSPVGRDIDTSPIQGRVAVVATWASWCRSCQAELETLKELHEGYGEERLALLVMGQDRDPAKGRTLRAKGLDFLFLQDAEARTMGVMGALAMPTTLVLSPEGMVLASWNGWDDSRRDALRAKLVELLGDPAER